MVIHTYSVIIQNSKTMEFFSQYQPLFADALNTNRIGVCKWNESGTTIDTALPELRNLTDDKEEWRAIVVRFIDDNCMAACETVANNPYDFLANSDYDNEVKESSIPLIRLTHMLGGIPPIEVQFQPEIIREAYKAPRTVYRPVINKQREEAHQALVNKYHFDGKAPSSIIIVSVRTKNYLADDTIGSAWLSHKESESSEFWKRNQYPSLCRFLVYDFEVQGPVQKEADNFDFWFSVLLISINDIDSSAMQAYRLYRVKTVIDKNAMSGVFQDMADRLLDAKHTIETDIRRDIENQICKEEPLPDYRMRVPVPLKLPQSNERGVKSIQFPLLSEGSRTDLAVWNGERRALEEDLLKNVRSADRMLDQTANKMRENCRFNEDEVEGLNKYQEEDLRRETDDLYSQIVSIQGSLPTGKVSQDPDISRVDATVKNILKERVVGSSAVTALCIAFALIMLSSIPEILRIINGPEGDYKALAYLLMANVIVITGAGLLVLVNQKFVLDGWIYKYNQYMKKAFNKLIDNTDDYAKYMSAIVSHARGSSYLNLSARKKNRYEEENYYKYKHIKAINILLGKLKTWSKAYHLDVDFTAKKSDARIEVNTMVAPIENKLYSFETGRLYPIQLNKSGMTIQSPFSFASRIEIVREELYEDRNN